MVLTQIRRTCALLPTKRQTAASKLHFPALYVLQRKFWLDASFLRKNDASAELESIQKTQICIEFQAKQTHQKCLEQYREWFNDHRANIIPEGQVMSLKQFRTASKRICEHICQQETQFWDEMPKIGSSDVNESDEDRDLKPNLYADAIHLTILRHRLTQLLERSEGVESLQEAFTVSDFCNMVESLIVGKHETWLKYQCILRDNDCDQKLTKDECTQLVDDIVSRHKAILKDIISLHVQLPKAAERSLCKSMIEETWRSKLGEKGRSIWHFAQPIIEKQDSVKALDFGTLLDSQRKEFPELTDLTNVFAKGFHKDRVLYHEERSDRWMTRRNGLMIIIGLGILDYASVLV
ncbi:unnamed protein product [Albugo candida]|uniref:EF-hand domain-containing protein n=1 Tax=Albugo candida TaxID=65357 RepID=A0A024G857_9STRA|nr:unnamed protein product [Albugo candida]|eukprot:CCI42849.1 unnamed protein product [Albugo candida]